MRDDAINLAKMHLSDNEIEANAEELVVKDIKHDIEVDLLDMKGR